MTTDSAPHNPDRGSSPEAAGLVDHATQLATTVVSASAELRALPKEVLIAAGAKATDEMFNATSNRDGLAEDDRKAAFDAAKARWDTLSAVLTEDERVQAIWLK